MRRASFWAAKAAAAALTAALLAAPARAHDADVEAIRQIDALYLHRDQGDNIARSLQLADAMLRPELEKDAPGVAAGYRWLRCRSLVRRGERRATKAEKLAGVVMRYTMPSMVVIASATAITTYCRRTNLMACWSTSAGSLFST